MTLSLTTKLKDSALPLITTKDHHNHKNILECSVIVGGTLSGWFSVQSKVRLSSFLSPYTGSQQLHWKWTPFSHLEDPEFASYVTPLSPAILAYRLKPDSLDSASTPPEFTVSSIPTHNTHNRMKGEL